MILLILLATPHLLRTVASEPNAQFNETLISSKYFVDKSELIKVFFEHNTHRGVFVTRPSGFGKTTNLRMIQKFCQVEVDTSSKNLIPQQETSAYKLFKDLKIAQHKDVVDKHLARHPVLYFDLTQFVIEGEITKQNIIDALDVVVKKALDEFSWLAGLYDGMNQTPPPYWNQTLYHKSIREFSTFLSEFFNGTDVIILIDGHDIPLQNAFLSHLDMVHRLHRTLQWMLRYLIRSESIKWNILISGENSLLFRYYDVMSFIHQDRFLSDYPYTSYFGFLKEELGQLTDKLGLSQDQKNDIEKYYGGYESLRKHKTLYNPSSVIDYLSNSPSTKDPLPKYKIGSNRTKIFWRFLRHMRFLRGASKLIKNCPIRHKFLEDFNLFDADRFIESIVLNPNSTEAHYRIHLTYSLQLGYITPLRQHSYIIPNIEARNIFLTDLRYHYEDWLEMDIKLLGNCLLDFTQASTETTINSTEPLQAALTASFQKLDDAPDNDTTNEFIFQSIIHIAALVNPQLTVDEDYPSPRLQSNTRELVHRQCVTVVKSGDTATVIKITHWQSDQVAFEKALNYSYNADGIKRVKYLAINVADDYETSLKHAVIETI